MSFIPPDLIIESVIRDGMTEIRNNPLIIDDIFSDLRQPYLVKKYGDAEINKIKRLFVNREVSLVHSFHLVSASVPCISIQLHDDPEDQGRAHLDDFEADVQLPLTDPTALAALVVVPSFTPNSYDPKTGFVSVPDGVDLTGVYRNLLFVDASQMTFQIVGAINNTPGSKQFGLRPGVSPNLVGSCTIQSSINYTQFEERGNADRPSILLGIHTKEPLVTKYLYTVVKRILLAHKRDLLLRGFQLPTYQGSDFSRSVDYPGDAIFDRFLTVTGTVQNAWASDLVTPLDNIDLEVTFEKDQYSGTQLGEDGLTVHPEDDSPDTDDT